jgi:phosphomannomutase
MAPIELRLRQRVEEWIAGDPDPATRSQLQSLVDAGDEPELSRLFRGRLEFGTAGIRGVLGPGPGRMNRAVARRVAAGIASVLLRRVPSARHRGVAVGYDMRNLSSEMALDVVGVLAGFGLPVKLLGGPNPTSLLAFAVLELGTPAGIMVTASHNPPDYNGIKVYWENGAQIVPPIDGEIASAIDSLASTADIPYLAPQPATGGRPLIELGVDLEARYAAAIAASLPPGGPSPVGRGLGIVYTPLHGVAWPLTRRVFRSRGLQEPTVVPEQAEPDPRFPTVTSPNPEEPEALELALELARLEGAALVLAHDPDGDRLGAAARDATGRYRVLHGDQVGALLGHRLLENHLAEGRIGPESFVVTTVVSSSLLSRIAELYGVRCELTLTGLKWIWNRALELERAGGHFVFGYEEALGYSVSPVVHDKDGISAGLLLSELAHRLAAEGKTLFDRLDEIYAWAGVVLTRRISLPVRDLDQSQAGSHSVLARARREWPELESLGVVRVSDFWRSEREDLETRTIAPIDLPQTPLLIFDLSGGRVVKLRPSGTEPKLKIYLEVREAPGPPARVPAVRERVATELDALARIVRQLV